MSKSLIRRLQARIRSMPTVDVAFVCPPIRPNPPVGEEALAAAESRLGFPLPPLVRALYTQVANGGYGPGYGVINLDGHDFTLVASRLRMNEETEPTWLWPPRFVEFVNWGCHYFSGVDCARPSCPVYFYNHDLSVGNATLTDCLRPEAASLKEWLSAWLDGVDLWERGKQRGLH